jgi:hypothetical protein
MLHVTRLEYLDGYRLSLLFSDGSTRIVDLEAELYGEMFAPLRDPARFAQAFLDPETRTVAWPNGADLAPEFLQELGQAIAPA